MALIVFDSALAATYAAGTPFLITGDHITLDFQISVTTSAKVNWYLEYTSQAPDSSARWFRECAEENNSGGIIKMPIVVRTLTAASDAALAPGVHRMSVQLVRWHAIARIQAAAASGTVSNLRVYSITAEPAIVAS
jgi:hypothetical protein